MKTVKRISGFLLGFLFVLGMEFDVLYFFASNPNIAFTKEQIYEAVSNDDYSGGAYIIRDII